MRRQMGFCTSAKNWGEVERIRQIRIQRARASVRFALFGAEAIKITNYLARKAALIGELLAGRLGFFGADLSQFAGIEPVAATVGTLIDLDAAFGAKEVPMELHARAARTLALAQRIDHDALIAADM